VTFRGPNVQAGDFAKWVRASAPSCHSRFDAVPAARIPAQKNASGAVHFFFPSELVNQRLELCFRFMYGGNVRPRLTSASRTSEPTCCDLIRRCRAALP